MRKDYAGPFCRTCKFFVNKVGKYAPTYGNCWRYPPTPYGTLRTPTQAAPQVSMDDGCGEHELDTRVRVD